MVLQGINFTLILVPLGPHHVANGYNADQLALIHQGQMSNPFFEGRIKSKIISI